MTLQELEDKVLKLERQLQNYKKILLECVKITTIIEKAAKSINNTSESSLKELHAPAGETKVEVIAETPKEIKIEPPKKELVDLLQSSEWPPAIDPSLIIDENVEQDKIDRAEGILDIIIDIHLENLRFLDYGCGEGYVVDMAKNQKPKMSVGYDIVKSPKWEMWEKAPNVFFTTDWDEVKQLGPYNIILMYDVLDHITWSDDMLIYRLRELKSILAQNGKVYIRCHPWTSRHGTHIYYQLNKAYAHIIFSDEELKSMGIKQDKVRKYKHPIHDYKKLFDEAGFRIHSGPIEIKESVETFFKDNQLVRTKIQEQYKDSIWEHVRKGDFPTASLEIQWIDYVLM